LYSSDLAHDYQPSHPEETIFQLLLSRRIEKVVLC